VKFQGLGWHTIHVTDANDVRALQAAFEEFKATADRPTLIVVNSVIGFGSPNKANTHGAHGAPLGEDECKLTKQCYGWPENEKFLVPAEVREHFAKTLGARGSQATAQWNALFAAYSKQHPAEAAQVQSILEGKLPAGWDQGLKAFAADAKGMATRVSSGKVLNMLSPHIPNFIGGSADLAPSTMTLIDGEKGFSHHDYSGRNMHFGIREHGMASVLNGMSLCGLRPYGATFFVFTDYMRPSMRLSSIMHQPVLYVLTHDSIGLGEDGPTHQPVEHLAACRAIPGLYVFRPGDANEVLHCYRAAMQITDHPSAMVLSRQNVPTMDPAKVASAAGAQKGGYIVSDCQGAPQAILIGTGTELMLCLKAQEQLATQGIAVRVVSMPCCELFDEQSKEYRDEVLPPSVTLRLACEAGLRLGWDKYIGLDGLFVGMTGFGASGPADQLYKHFKITSEQIVLLIRNALA
jgi:transketolase